MIHLKSDHLILCLYHFDSVRDLIDLWDEFSLIAFRNQYQEVDFQLISSIISFWNSVVKALGYWTDGQGFKPQHH